MKSYLLKKPWLMFVAGLLLGTLVFFPTNALKEKLFSSISKNTGAVVLAESMSIGTGLSLGLSMGGLLGLHFKKFRIQSTGFGLDCDEATLSPHLASFFVGNLSIGIGCESEKHGSLSAKLSLKPFWKPERLSLESSFKGFNLKAISNTFDNYPIKGIVLGNLNITDMSLLSRGVLPPMDWKLSLQKAVLPPLSSTLVTLPEITLGTLDTSGSLKNGKLVMAPLKMGGPGSPLKMDVNVDLMISSQLVPNSGEIKGKLWADPAWEASIKKSIDLELLFGSPNETGDRRFRKIIQGGPMSLLNPPLPYE